MAQMKEYRVVSSKRWGGRIQAKPDDEGYFMHTIAVEGQEGTPLDYKSKLFPEVGQVLHGELVEYVSSRGDNRVRFETSEYKKKDSLIQDRIVAQFALRLAVEHSVDHTNRDEVMSLARHFIGCVNELTKIGGEKA